MIIGTLSLTETGVSNRLNTLGTAVRLLVYCECVYSCTHRHAHMRVETVSSQHTRSHQSSDTGITL